MSPSSTTIADLLREARTIAVVGFSPNPARDSHEVAAYLQAHGYRIIPINPACAGSIQLGEHCYPSLSQAAKALHEAGLTIDIVDCFRRSEHIDAIAEEAIAIGARALWMQLGIVNAAAATKAGKAGLQVIMDRCIKIDHAHMLH